MVQSRIIIQLLAIKNFYTQITQIVIRILTQKWLNIIQYLAQCYSIFASRLNTSTSNHHIFASSTIGLRYQILGIRLDGESRSVTPLCQNLPLSIFSAQYRSVWLLHIISQVYDAIYIVTIIAVVVTAIFVRTLKIQIKVSRLHPMSVSNSASDSKGTICT